MSAQTPYQLLGGAEAIKQLSSDFYTIMDSNPAFSELRHLHGLSLDNIEEKLFEYLSGWLGGPHIYKEKYGTICLTTPHKAYAINSELRDQWLQCMQLALEKSDASVECKNMLQQPLYELADFLRNQ